jgi:hypothetical protein
MVCAVELNGVRMVTDFVVFSWFKGADTPEIPGVQDVSPLSHVHDLLGIGVW